MIEAGVAVLLDWEEFFVLGPTFEKMLVREILSAALEDDAARPTSPTEEHSPT
jgi:hypothetical protein